MAPPGPPPIPGQGAQSLSPRAGWIQTSSLDPKSTRSFIADSRKSWAWRQASAAAAAAPCICAGAKPRPWHETPSLAVVSPALLGAAWAHKHAGTDNVAATYFGDGAVNIGSVLETMNLAAAWKLPLLFQIESNQYAVSTTVAESNR